MSVLVWVHDHFWWLALGVVPCLAAVGWALWAGRYQPVHAAAGLPVGGESWVPWDTDPRFGSMQLADDVAVGGWEYRSTSGISYPVALPPLWREVAHEGDWRAQTATDLAPATLDSGPGGPSLAPGPDWNSEIAWTAPPGDKPRSVEAGASGGRGIVATATVAPPPATEPEPVRTVAGRLVETSDEWLRRLVADARKVLVPADELPGDWPGWTWAGTVAA